MLASEGRVIMISGANRGIGRGLAEALYDDEGRRRHRHLGKGVDGVWL